MRCVCVWGGGRAGAGWELRRGLERRWGGAQCRGEGGAWVVVGAEER